MTIAEAFAQAFYLLCIAVLGGMLGSWLLACFREWVEHVEGVSCDLCGSATVHLCSRCTLRQIGRQTTREPLQRLEE